MSKVLRSATGHGLIYWCQGCRGIHSISYGPGQWTWNGDVNRPTFTHSVLVTGVEKGTEDEYRRIMAGEKITPRPLRCHTFVTDGMVNFLSDCTHQYAGQMLPLPDLPDYLRDDYDRPVLDSPSQGNNPMSKIKVAVAVVDSPLPAGAALFAMLLLTVIDSAGAEQSARLNGQEDEPFTTTFNVADGAGKIKAVALDVNDAVIEGSAIEQDFTAGVAAPTEPEVPTDPVIPAEPVGSFKQPIGLTVTNVEG